MPPCGGLTRTRSDRDSGRCRQARDGPSSGCGCGQARDGHGLGDRVTQKAVVGGPDLSAAAESLSPTLRLDRPTRSAALCWALLQGKGAGARLGRRSRVRGEEEARGVGSTESQPGNTAPPLYANKSEGKNNPLFSRVQRRHKPPLSEKRAGGCERCV